MLPLGFPVYVTQPLIPPLEDFTKRLADVWESKWLTNIGEQHDELERRLRGYLQAEHLTLFNNGTLALMLGIKALHLQGEVITTPFTFPATVECLDWNDLQPVFADIDPITLNLNPAGIEPLITEKTSAILAVHVFGTPCDVEGIQNVADRHGLKVIYDAAHAFGLRIGGKPIGGFGDLSMFSFHATKLFNTIEGGALVFRDASLAVQLDLLKNFGIEGPESVLLSGINAKMNEIQAAMGIEVLKLVEGERQLRARVCAAYRKILRHIPGISIAHGEDDEDASLQYFVIRIDPHAYGQSRDWLYLRLRELNVFTRKYFYPLCSTFHWYRGLPSAEPSHLPVATRVSGEVLALPLYGGLGEELAERIADFIRQLREENGNM